MLNSWHVILLQEAGKFSHTSAEYVQGHMLIKFQKATNPDGSSGRSLAILVRRFLIPSISWVWRSESGRIAGIRLKLSGIDYNIANGHFEPHS